MQISYVNIFVNNLVSAIQFYEGKLELSLQFSSLEHGYASFLAGNITLGVAVPADEESLVGRHTGIGFAVPDLQMEYDRLSKLGVSFTMPPTRQPWGGFMALFADPDGNVFYLDQVSDVHG